MADRGDTVPTIVETTPGPAGVPEGRLIDGMPLGRYVVLGLLGQGGMGQVYRGYDPKLRREVAVKVLSDDGGEAAVARLVREAQAMARLSHPNVVPVYDVEQRDGRVFLAMELVEGKTLSRWLREDHPRAEVLPLLIAAGRGLAAAHAVDLVHRDFKPGNVMVGDDGRARVMDFGIARGSLELASEDPLPERSGGRDPSVDSLSAPLTRAGVVLGTPSYMAPEQHHGEPVDHRCDQYAFCVTVYQALSGARPFRSRHGEDMAAIKLQRPPPPLPGAPKHIQRAVARGLAPRPEDRFESMDALLSALQPRGVSSMRKLAAVGAVGAAVAGVLGVSQWTEARREAACDDAATVLAAVYDDTAREAITASLSQSGAAYAATTASSTLEWLDTRAEQWADAARVSCRRGTVQRVWDDTTRARADWCLAGSRADFVALVERLAVADDVDVETAVERAAGLTAASRCVDERALASLEEPPADGGQAVRAVLDAVARAGALVGSKKVDEGLADARTALAAAESVPSGSAVAAAQLVIAAALDARGQFAEGTDARKLAFFAAMESGAQQLAGTAATGLVFSTGLNLARHDEARDWFRHAQIALRNGGGDPDGLALAKAEHNLALVEFRAGELPAAKARMQGVVEVRTATLGASHPAVAVSLNMLGSALGRSGDRAAARPLFERALAIQKQAYGADHPAVAMTLHNIATGLHVDGQFAEARALYERSLAIRTRALRPDHPDIGMSLNNLAGIAWELGDKRESLELSQRALSILESQYGPDHPQVANSLTGVAGTHVELGEERHAVPLLRRAVAIYDQHPGGPDSNEPTARFALAKALRATGGDATTARAQAGKARALYLERGDAGAKALADVDAFLAALAPQSAG